MAKIPKPPPGGVAGPADDDTLKPGLPRGAWMALIAAFLGWMFDGLEMGLFPLVARPALLELMDSQQQMGTWMSIVIAVFLIGAALGGIIFGWLGDRIGRVRAMVWSVLIYSIFSGLCAFAQEPWHLAVLRFIAALGMGGEWSLGVALVMEIWPSNKRPLLAGLIGAASNVGFLLIGLLGWGMTVVGLPALLRSLYLTEDQVTYLLGANGDGWRVLMLLGAVPAFLTLFIRIFVPESERWREAAASGPKTRLADIFAPGLAPITIIATCLGAVALMGTWGSVQWTPAWANRMSGGAAEATALTQIYSAAGAIFGTMLAAQMADWFSRRWAYFMIALASLLVCGYLFRVTTEFDQHFLWTVAAVGAVTGSFYGWLPLYLPELFPTRMRATGQGFAFNFGRVLAAAGALGSGQLLNYFDEDYARTGSYTSLIYLIPLVLIWFAPETKGKPLPD